MERCKLRRILRYLIVCIERDGELKGASALKERLRGRERKRNMEECVFEVEGWY